MKIPDPDEIDNINKNVREAINKQNRMAKLSAYQNRVKPQTIEPESPMHAESTPQKSDEDAKTRKEELPQVSMGSIRPQPPSTGKEEGSVIVAKELAGQLGTSPEIKGDQRIDERKMSVLQPRVLASLSHFSYRWTYDEIRYWGHITEWWLTGSQGINGLGRRHILTALANTSGIQTIEKADKPNVVARNLWHRAWKQEAEKEGKIVET